VLEGGGQPRHPRACLRTGLHLSLPLPPPPAPAACTTCPSMRARMRVLLLIVHCLASSRWMTTAPCTRPMSESGITSQTISPTMQFLYPFLNPTHHQYPSALTFPRLDPQARAGDGGRPGAILTSARRLNPPALAFFSAWPSTTPCFLLTCSLNDLFPVLGLHLPPAFPMAASASSPWTAMALLGPYHACAQAQPLFLSPIPSLHEQSVDEHGGGDEQGGRHVQEERQCVTSSRPCTGSTPFLKSNLQPPSI
jgi:hypothetical protein